MQDSRTRFGVCICEQRSAAMRHTVPLMQLQRANAVAATWILAAGLIGLAGNVTSIGGAVMVLGFGLVPPILMMLRWRAPALALSKRIHPAQR
jgi:hypothetical protein